MIREEEARARETHQSPADFLYASCGQKSNSGSANDSAVRARLARTSVKQDKVKIFLFGS